MADRKEKEVNITIEFSKDGKSLYEFFSEMASEIIKEINKSNCI